jgi:hypothetical protein
VKYIEPIWIHPELEGGGYSAAKVYECADFYVSAGGISSHVHAREHGNPMIVLFNFTDAGVGVVGSDQEWAEWKKLKTDEQKQEYAYRLLLHNLGIERFRLVLAGAYERGAREGRNALRRKLGELLSEE